MLIAVMLAVATASCPDSSWRENPATGKCYKVPQGYVGHWSCPDKCGPQASLACLEDNVDNQFIANWLQTDGIPGTPRATLWIGNYYTSSNGWAQCAGGQFFAYANWTMEEPVYAGNSYSDPTRPVNNERFQQGACALFDASPGYAPAWWARDCLHWYHCLCESGVGTSEPYQAWTDANMADWMAPWWARGAWTLIVGALVGIVPSLVAFARSLCKKPPADWATRVRSRVQSIMNNLGWLAMCVGFAPIIAFFSNLHAVYTIGYPQGYGALIPMGLTCFLLAVIPTDERSARCGLILSAVVFTLFAVIGLLALLFWGVWSFWLMGVLLGAIFLVAGAGLTVVIVRELRAKRDARRRVRCVWRCTRLFFAVLFVVSFILLIEYTVNLASQFSENVGWILLASSSLIFSVVTRPVWRARFCMWLSGVGVKVGDKAEADSAARLIWIEVTEKTSPSTATA